MLEIERTAHHPHSGIPYLPGSSLKGAMRTAWLDKLNGGSGKHPEDRGAADMERRLLGGGFHEDPFRLIRMADAAGDRVASKVFFSTNHKKRVVTDKAGNTVVAKGVAARREAILGGQLRAFAGEIRFDRLVGVGESRGRDGKPLTPGMTHRIGDFAALAKACNAYYLKRFEAECAILDSRRFVDPDWLASIRGLLQVLRPAFDDGKALLLRVGRHSGAESVTLDGVRNIKIMAGKGQQAQWSSEGAKTVWLAAETEQDRSGMLPFGWLLVEMEASKPAAELEAWCERQPKPDLDAVRAILAEARKSAAEDADRRRMAEKERAAAQVRAAHLAAEREARLLAMSENGRAIAALVQACEARAHEGRKDPFNPGQGLYAKALQLSRHALADGGGWSAEDRLALAEAIETWLPKSVERLDRKDDWKDARKRLKLAELRPEAR
jgi:CRISPR-associated protein Csm5